MEWSQNFWKYFNFFFEFLITQFQSCRLPGFLFPFINGSLQLVESRYVARQKMVLVREAEWHAELNLGHVEQKLGHEAQRKKQREKKYGGVKILLWILTWLSLSLASFRFLSSLWLLLRYVFLNQQPPAPKTPQHRQLISNRRLQWKTPTWNMEHCSFDDNNIFWSHFKFYLRCGFGLPNILRYPFCDSPLFV